VLPVSFRRLLRLTVIMDAITHIPTEAITIDIGTKGIITSITIGGIITGTGVGWSALVGVRDIIGIGKRIDDRIGLTNL
jgi:hypothetical protein